MVQCSEGTKEAHPKERPGPQGSPRCRRGKPACIQKTVSCPSTTSQDQEMYTIREDESP